LADRTDPLERWDLGLGKVNTGFLFNNILKRFAGFIGLFGARGPRISFRATLTSSFFAPIYLPTPGNFQVVVLFAGIFATISFR